MFADNGTRIPTESQIVLTEDGKHNLHASQQSTLDK